MQGLPEPFLGFAIIYGIPLALMIIAGAVISLYEWIEQLNKG